MKRSRSPDDNGSDSCDDDAFSEEMCAVTGSTIMSSSTGGGSTRKRRRGVIEKKRRDRINCSLNELKRLVPMALEKSASAKLEKAEILQMTVEHLKAIESPSSDSKTPSSDPNSHRFAMDYHGFGFRECAAEVARYLSSVEGLDSQDPLRLRLMSHLQIFAAQRGVVASSPQPPPPPHQPVAAAPQHYHAHAQHQHVHPDPHGTAAPWPNYNGYDAAAGKINTALGPGYEHISAAAANFPGTFDYFSSPPTPSSSRPSSHYTPSISTSSSSSFSPLSSSVSSSSPSPLFSSGYGPAPPAPTAATPAKPYRPWGAEMAC